MLATHRHLDKAPVTTQQTPIRNQVPHCSFPRATKRVERNVNCSVGSGFCLCLDRRCCAESSTWGRAGSFQNLGPSSEASGKTRNQKRRFIFTLCCVNTYKLISLSAKGPLIPCVYVYFLPPSHGAPLTHYA